MLVKEMSKLRSKTIFDTIIIGGGPAGMMACIFASEKGARVLLIEKNKDLGKKLLLTGKRRCNLTNAEYDNKEFVKKIGKGAGFLLSGLSFFGPRETIDFFEKRGLKTKTERGKRVFPESDRACDVLNLLSGCLKKNSVKVLLNTEVKGFQRGPSKITGVLTKKGQVFLAKNYILCSGGKSYPATGSSGDGFLWAKETGHNIIKPRPALVPLKIKESWIRELQGLSLKNIELSVYQGGKRKEKRFGELLFTHFGISGPIVLDMSKKIGALHDLGLVHLVLDLKPVLNFSMLDKRIQRDFKKYQNKVFKNSLKDLLPRKMIPCVIGLSGINAEERVSNIKREERHVLVRVLKGMKMTLSNVLGFEEAIITKGGVSLGDIDSKTMRSKMVDNLFFAGEIIDLDGPTGGYNLQICWTTGYVAGRSAGLKR